MTYFVLFTESPNFYRERSNRLRYTLRFTIATQGYPNTKVLPYGNIAIHHIHGSSWHSWDAYEGSEFFITPLRTKLREERGFTSSETQGKWRCKKTDMVLDERYAEIYPKE